MKTIDGILDDLIAKEGGYSDHPNDAGGATCWGITEKVARANGYAGDMRVLPVGVARYIYASRYVQKPKFDKVMLLSADIAAELVDTGVNMGIKTASSFLQRVLNALNQRGALYPDLLIDGDCGAKTQNALAVLLKSRGKLDGEKVVLRGLNCLQGERYITLAESRAANEDFVYGWLMNRVAI